LLCSGQDSLATPRIVPCSVSQPGDAENLTQARNVLILF
jgi:hypothetical protein